MPVLPCGRFHSSTFLAKPPLLGFNIFTSYRVALVVLFPTKLDSLDSDFICKSYGSSGFTVRSGPEMVRSLRPHRSLRPKGPGISGPVFFVVLCQSVVRPYCLSGGTPEMVRSLRSHRSLRPKGPGISGPVFFAAKCLLRGAVLDRGPEHPRRVPGVSGQAGVSGPLDRNLRPPR